MCRYIKARVLPLLMIAIFSLSLVGCGLVQEVNLTKEEEEQIVGYAADILLKYDRNHHSNLVDTEAARELDARVEAMKELNAKVASDTSKPETSDSNGNDGNGGSSGSSGLAYPPEGEQDIAAALGQEGVSIAYTGYEVCSSYPYDGSAGDYFAMDATAGKQLMVFHFDVFNSFDQELECRILDRYPVFRVIVNDSERINALTTLLENDLATVDKTLTPGEHYDAVVVLETEPGYEESVTSLSLLMKHDGQQSVIPLS